MVPVPGEGGPAGRKMIRGTGEEWVMRARVMGLALGLMLGGGACATIDRPVDARMTTAPRDEVRPAAVRSPVGGSVRALVAAHAGRRMQFFDEGGNAVDGVPDGASGSVSIHTPGEDGQDNYAFDETGIVVRHQRSVGADYGAGVWVDVPAAR